MRRLAAVLVLLFTLLFAAQAEGLCPLSEYFDRFDLGQIEGASGWTEEVEGRLYSVSPGRDILISLCAEDGDLLAVSVTAPRGERCKELAGIALPLTGRISEAALDDVLAEGKDAEAGRVRVVLLTGDLREGVYLFPAEAQDALFWQPLHGGEERHRSPKCSGMDVPRLITTGVAEALGFPPCEICAAGESAGNGSE